MFVVFAPLLLGLLLPVVGASDVRFLRSQGLATQSIKNGEVTCRLQVTFLMLNPGLPGSDSDSLEVLCNEPNGMQGDAYEIVGLSASHELSDFVNQEIRLFPAKIDQNSHAVRVNNTTSIQSLSTEGPSIRRRLRARPSAIGNRTVLALKVSFLDQETSYSLHELSDNLFGPDDGSITMRSQFAACSFGKLIMNPAEGENITNGVAEIQILNNTSDYPSRWYAEQDAKAAASRVFSIEDGFDHVIFCMPPGIRRNANEEDWFAYAYPGDTFSFYNNMACLYVSVTMHELGHNFGMGHSNSGSRYGDTTGMMGRGTAEIGSPRKCFNGEKNYLLGWYSDRVAEVDVLVQQQAWKGTLVGFPDYDKTTRADEFVVVKINGAVDNNGKPRPFYVQWNRAKSMNRGSDSLRNLIVTVKGYAPYRLGYYGSFVVPVAPHGGIALDTNEWRYVPPNPHQQRIENFADSGHALVIEICSQEYGLKDTAILSIHLDDGVQHSACVATATAQPLSSPTLIPSSRPTQFCEDDSQYFETKQYGTINCLWLRFHRAAQKLLCRRGQEVYHRCPDTCRKCFDHCEDDQQQGRFLVNRIRGEKTCQWLSVRPAWQKLLCQIEDHPARLYCQETCNSCRPIETGTANNGCKDSASGTVLFHVNKVQGNRTCSWLSQSLVWKRYLCRPGQQAYIACAKTCGRCRDQCEDKEGDFWVEKLQDSRDCRWLSIRPLWQQILCFETIVSDLCNESCNSCSR